MCKLNSKGGQVLDIAENPEGICPHAQEEQSLMGIHNLRRITEVMLLRIKFQGIQTDIFLHNHTTSK